MEGVMKKRSWFLIIVSLLWAMAAALSFADQAWWDPLGRNPHEGSMGEDVAGGDTILAFGNRNIDYTLENGITDDVVYLLIESDILDNIDSRYPSPGANDDNFLFRYVEALALDYDVVVFSVPQNAMSAGQLKAQLKTAYEDGVGTYGKLCGAVFIGDLPAAWYEYDNDYANDPAKTAKKRTVFPCDLYFMDLNGEWVDQYIAYVYDPAAPLPETDINGLLEDHPDIRDPYHIDKSKLAPEIWIGRLPVHQYAEGEGADYVASETAILGAYIEKNLAYRNGDISTAYTALSYLDQSEFTAGGYDEAGIALRSGYESYNVTSFSGNVSNASLTDKDHYAPLLEGANEWVHAGITSSAFCHTFGDEPFDHDSNDDGQVTGDDYLTADEIAALKPKGFFYNFSGAGIARFTEEGFIGGSYIFPAGTNGLVLLGSTKSGGMKRVYTFYDSLCSSTPRTIGESLIEWFKGALIDPYTDPVRDAYGLAIIGDPTLMKSDDPVRTAIDNGMAWVESKQTLGDSGNVNYGSWANSVPLTALSVLTLLNQGRTLEDPADPQNAVDRGIRYIISNIDGINPSEYISGTPVRTQTYTYSFNDVDYLYAFSPGDSLGSESYENRYTYSTALAIMAVAATNNHAYDEVVLRMFNFLFHSQWDEDSIVGKVGNWKIGEIMLPVTISGVKAYGGFGYGFSGSRPDNSNTQFAMMGIKVALDFLDQSENTDIMPDADMNEFMRKCMVWFDATRDLSSSLRGFGYGTQSATKTMSAAALWSLATLYHRVSPEYQTMLDDFMRDAEKYLESDYTIPFSSSAGYYYAYTLSKGIMMSNHTEFFGEGVHWFKYISSEIIDEQLSDGSWWADSWLATAVDYMLNTTFALLSLELDKIPPQAFETITLESHCDLHLYDTLGRHTGANYEAGIIENRIPGTRYVIISKENVEYIDEETGELVAIAEGDEVEYDGGFVDDYGFEIKQVIVYSKPISGNYRIELVGVGEDDPAGGDESKPYHLEIAAGMSGEVFYTRQIEGEIKPGQVLETTKTLAPLNGPINVYVGQQMSVSPIMEVSDEPIELLVRPGIPVTHTFEIKNKAEIEEEDEIVRDRMAAAATIKDCRIYCTKLQGESAFIEGNKVTFQPEVIAEIKPGIKDVSEGETVTVTLTVAYDGSVPGPVEGMILIETKNGGNKAIPLIVNTNTQPVSVAGDDQLLYAGADGTDLVTVTLDGSGSWDHDGDALTCAWYMDGERVAEGVSPQLTLSPGEYVISLIVSDGYDLSEPDTLSVTVVEPLQAFPGIHRTIVVKDTWQRWVVCQIMLADCDWRTRIDRSFEMCLVSDEGTVNAVWFPWVFPFRLRSVRGLLISAFFPVEDIIALHDEAGWYTMKMVVRLEDGRYVHGNVTFHVIEKVFRHFHKWSFPKKQGHNKKPHGK